MIIEELIGLLGWKMTGEGDLKRFQNGMDKVNHGLERMAALAVAAGAVVGAAMAGLAKGVVNVWHPIVSPDAHHTEPDILMISVKVKRKRGGGGKGVAGIVSLKPGPNQVKVGFPAGKADGGVIARAVFQEFGTKGGASGGGWGGPIPERPFMRNALRNGKGQLQADMVKAARSILTGAAKGQDAAVLKRQALSKLGIKTQGLIQQEITSLASPPNSPVTIALKGSSNPLIDSGEMRGAVTWSIEE